MNKDQAIKLIREINITHPGLTKDYHIPPGQMKMYKLVQKHKEINSSRASKELSNSVYSATIILRLLYTKGYLTRKPLLQESGGVEYIYQIAE